MTEVGDIKPLFYKLTEDADWVMDYVEGSKVRDILTPIYYKAISVFPVDQLGKYILDKSYEAVIWQIADGSNDGILMAVHDLDLLSFLDDNIDWIDTVETDFLVQVEWYVKGIMDMEIDDHEAKFIEVYNKLAKINNIDVDSLDSLTIIEADND